MKKKERFLSRFSSRKTILEADILRGFTDIHSHYLPGVDDGFKTREDTIAGLLMMKEWGVERIYFTPHAMADYPGNVPEFLKERFSAFCENAPGGLELRLSAEYMLDEGFAKQMDAGLLPLGKNHVLIEMSYMYPSPELMNILYDLQIKEYVPLLAHPERYLFMDKRQYNDLKDKGCKYQLNLMSLTGQYGTRAYDVSWYLLQNNMYDFAGTDIHHANMFRYNMERLKLTGEEQELLRNLTRQNNLLW